MKAAIPHTLFILIALFALTFTACTVNPPSAVGEQSSLLIRVTGGTNRTLFPNLALSYAVVFENAEQRIDGVLDSSGTGAFNLPAGFWNVTLTAKAGGIDAAAASAANVELKPGERKELRLTLVPLSGAAGNFSYAVQFPAEVQSALLSIDNAHGVPVAGSPFNVKNQKNGMINLEPGSFLLRLNLKYGIAQASAGRAEAFHIYAGQTTGASYTFYCEDFPMYLYADTAQPAYSLLSSKGYGYETPDRTAAGGHTGTPHITQRYDAILKKDVFAFETHYALDGNDTGDQTRQRVEIKIDDDDYRGKDGRAFTYRWKFKLPADFAPSTEFTHIHQIKNEGGDASAPVITLSPRLSGNTKRMQLIYRAPTYNYGTAPESSPNRYLLNAANSLNDFLGEWVQAEESVTYSGDPAIAAYSITVTRIRDNVTLLSYTHTPAQYAALEPDTAKWPFITWRAGNTYGRPKHGLYRLIWQDAGLTIPVQGLKDETILYADFELIRNR